jgi:hypothetical protein
LAPRKIAAVLAIPAGERAEELIFPKSHRPRRINTDN